jgi:hypothetical protein
MPSGTTEAEILDLLKGTLRQAIEHCTMLANLPARGPTYNAFRHELLLIEGACRQMCYWRGDTRWLPIGMMMEEAHKRAGHWLRKHFPRPLFLKLADNLKALLVQVERTETAATGVLGPILPEVQAAPLKQGRTVQVKTPGGIIIPAGVSV